MITVVLIIVGEQGSIAEDWRDCKSVEESDDPDRIIVKIDRNTEKSPGDLRRLQIT